MVMIDVNRRRFVLAAVAATGCACLPSCAAMRRGQGPAAPPGPVDMGTIGDYPRDGITDKWAQSHEVMIVRDKGRLLAVSAVCTHRGCIVDAGEDGFRCPCHGSRYTREGAVTKGPAKEALSRYAIVVNDQGRVTVDTSKRFDAGQSNDPAAFVTLKA
jgi:nitrite reductase/ring-hydroxylating ferredoxin subunit